MRNKLLISLLIVIAAIVVLPWWLIRDSVRRNQQAAEMVTHTYRVEAGARALTYDVRDLEAATLAIGAGIDNPILQQRIRESQAALPEDLDNISKLTRDSPEQQMRIGTLRAKIDERLQLLKDIQSTRDEVERKKIMSALTSRLAIRQIVQDIMDHEERQLRERQETALRTRAQVDLANTLSTLAQFALLGLLAWWIQREWRNRLQAESETRRASAHAASVMRTMREPVVLLDAQHRVLSHNPAFVELYEMPEHGDIGAPLTDFGTGAWQQPELLQRLRDVLHRDRELWDFQIAQRTRDGSQRNMLINARAMQLPDHAQEKVALVTISDITARVLAEQQIRELNRQLEGKVAQVSEINQELEAFSYSVSHDLRAPLRHISGFATKLGTQLGDGIDDKSAHYIDVISTSAQRMAALIDDLLVYSRLGRSVLRLQAVDMQSLVEETRAMLDSNAKTDQPDRRIDWKIAPLPIVIADENMMRQAWLNLLGNAVKYSSHANPSVIEIGHRQLDDGTHQFDIRDNGAGFDMAYAGKLFGVFQRMHRATEFPGTGIGLASVRRVLLRHGGRIWAESAPDAGSTFHFTLPQTPDHAASSNGVTA